MARYCDLCGTIMGDLEEYHHPKVGKEKLLCASCYDKIEANKLDKIKVAKKKEELEGPVTNIGVVSTIFGVTGILIYFFIGFVTGSHVISAVSLPIGIVAVAFGITAKKRGDKYGRYGIILGLISSAFGLITLIALIINIYLGSMV